MTIPTINCCCDPPPGPGTPRPPIYNLIKIDAATGVVEDYLYARAASTTSANVWDITDLIRNDNGNHFTVRICDRLTAGRRRMVRIDENETMLWELALEGFPVVEDPTLLRSRQYPNMAPLPGGRMIFGDIGGFGSTSPADYYIWIEDDGTVSAGSGVTGIIQPLGVYTIADRVFAMEPADGSSAILRELDDTGSTVRSHTFTLTFPYRLTGLDPSNADLFYYRGGGTPRLTRRADDWVTEIFTATSVLVTHFQGSDMFCANEVRFAKRTNAAGFAEIWGTNLGTVPATLPPQIRRIQSDSSLVYWGGSVGDFGGDVCHVFATDHSGTKAWTLKLPGTPGFPTSNFNGVTGMVLVEDKLWVSCFATKVT